MKDELTPQQADAILKALDEAITTGPWEESNFLRVIGKNLREIRDNFANQLEGGEQEKQPEPATRMALRSGQQEVFIALYSSEGNALQSWERILANLPRYVISRPIYANEVDVQTLIKSKENKINEAYVAVYINQSDILTLPPDKIPLDRFGRALITLKDRAINLDNISRFIHFSGVYTYTKGRLIKTAVAES